MLSSEAIPKLLDTVSRGLLCFRNFENGSVLSFSPRNGFNLQVDGTCSMPLAIQRTPNPYTRMGPVC